MKTKMSSRSKKIKGGNKTFFLYTTGIADWGNVNTIVPVWNNILLPKLLEILLNHNFTTISINHYDLETDLANTPFAKNYGENKESFHIAINEALNTKIAKIKSLYGNEIDISSNYIPEAISFDEIQENGFPHLIVDFAHLLNYQYLPENMKSIPYMNGERGDKIFYPGINSIYFGYVGENIERSNVDRMGTHVPLINLLSTNFLKIDERDNIYTYIDKISEHSLLNNLNPVSRPGPGMDPRINLRENLNSNRNSREFIGLIYPELTIRKLYEISQMDVTHPISFDEYLQEILGLGP